MLLLGSGIELWFIEAEIEFVIEAGLVLLLSIRNAIRSVGPPGTVV